MKDKRGENGVGLMIDIEKDQDMEASTDDKQMTTTSAHTRGCTGLER